MYKKSRDMKKYLQTNWRPLAVLAFFCVSLGAMILAICYDSIPVAVAGLPCFALLLSALHECGHLIGCKINGNPITALCVVFFEIRFGRVFLLQYPKLQSYCTFKRQKRNVLAFLGGPLMSLCATLVVWLLFQVTDAWVWTFYLLISLTHFLKNLIPAKSSDMQALLNERKR